MSMTSKSLFWRIRIKNRVLIWENSKMCWSSRLIQNSNQIKLNRFFFVSLALSCQTNTPVDGSISVPFIHLPPDFIRIQNVANSHTPHPFLISFWSCSEVWTFAFEFWLGFDFFEVWLWNWKLVCSSFSVECDDWWQFFCLRSCRNSLNFDKQFLFLDCHLLITFTGECVSIHFF